MTFAPASVPAPSRTVHFPFKRASTVAVCALLGSVWCIGTQAQVPPVPTSNRFGVAHDSGTSNPNVAQAVRDAGFGWVHYTMYWYQVNPSPGVYQWILPDFEIGQFAAAGLNVYVRIGFPPTWTTGASYPNDQVPYFCLDESQPGNLKNHPDCGNPNIRQKVADFREFVRAAVNRYRGKVQAWGFGTEVGNSEVFWPKGNDQNPVGPTAFAREVLRPGYEEVKTIDPSLLVVGPDEDSGGSLFTMLNLEPQIGRWADVISYHALSHSKANIQTIDDELKPIVDQRGGGRPVWVTELGYRSPGPSGDAAQTTWVMGMLQAIRLRPWIDKTFLYNLINPQAASFAILNPDGTPKPVFNAAALYLDQQPLPRFSYLAEGATGGFFDLDIALANPTGTDAPVKLSFLKEDGSVATWTTAPNAPLRANSRLTVPADLVPGLTAGGGVSTVVESTTGVPIVVERTMFWDANRYGGHGGTAVSQPATTWYFAEGSQGFFDTWLLLANSSIQPALVTVRFLRETGPPVVRQIPVGPTSRVNVFAGSYQELVNTSFSIVVESTTPIIAERAMYFGGPPQWLAGHESAGVTAPAQNWFLAEGATGPYFDEYVLIGNPNGVAANVTVNFLRESGAPITRNYPMAAQSRLTIKVDDVDPALADAAVSTTVSADVPVVTERAMYWPGAFTSWSEAHNSFGVTQAATRWALAEGRAGLPPFNYETYILIANPSAQTATVRVTFLKPDGTTVERTADVAPSTRYNVYGNEAVPNAEFGALVESTNGVPIVVERAMYWDALGLHWAGGTNATATPLP